MTFIIAEAGVNHNGDVGEALRLVDAAKAAGADAVKFQMFSSERLWGDDRIANLELPWPDMLSLHQHCVDVGIEFMATPFGIPEVVFLHPLCKRIKVASGMICDRPFLKAVNATGLPVICSTGMASWEDIEVVLSELFIPFTILHCTSAYPCPPADVNMKAMHIMRDLYGPLGIPIGYSDHTEGITIALAAVAMGATVLEKHFTMDRNAVGPDHKASIEPLEFAQMVRGIRDIESAMGDGVKRVMPSEAELRKVWRCRSA